MKQSKRFGLFKRKKGALAGDERGVAALEFAMAFPVVLLLILAAIEFGYVLFANSVLEGAVREASRRGSTGYAPCDMTREEYIQALVDREMLSFSDKDKRTITQTVYNNFNDIEGEPFADTNGNGYYDTNEPFSDVNGNAVYDRNLGAAGLGNSGAIVVYDIEYQLKGLSGWFAKQIGSERAFTIGARATVRNEPAAMDGTFGGTVEDCDIDDE